MASEGHQDDPGSSGVVIQYPDPESPHDIPRALFGETATTEALEAFRDGKSSLRNSLLMASGVLYAREMPGCSAAVLVAIKTLFPDTDYVDDSVTVLEA